MKSSLTALALLLLAATALPAAPLPADFLASLPGGAPAADLPAFLSSPATPVVASSDCSPPRYFCQACPITIKPVRLCSETVCGTVVILNCGDCAPTCVLPPS